MIDEVCGHETPNGPCNMKKNHAAPFHRNRAYKRAVQWRIKDGSNNDVLEFGSGRVQLGYALSRILVNHNDLLIEITK